MSSKSKARARDTQSTEDIGAVEAIQAAEQRLAEAAARLAELEAEAAAKTAEADELEPKIPGLLYVDPARGREARQVVRALRDEAADARDAATVASRELAEARRGLLRAHAEDRTRRADRLWRARRALLARLEVPLRQLSEIEGCEYVPAADNARGKRLGPNETVKYRLPHSEILEQEARSLRASAERLRGSAENDSDGKVEAIVSTLARRLSDVERCVSEDGTVTGLPEHVGRYVRVDVGRPQPPVDLGPVRVNQPAPLSGYASDFAPRG